MQRRNDRHVVGVAAADGARLIQHVSSPSCPALANRCVQHAPNLQMLARLVLFENTRDAKFDRNIAMRLTGLVEVALCAVILTAAPATARAADLVKLRIG